MIAFALACAVVVAWSAIIFSVRFAMTARAVDRALERALDSLI